MLSCAVVDNSLFTVSPARAYVASAVSSTCALLAGGSTSGYELWPTAVSGALDVFGRAGDRVAPPGSFVPRAGAAATTNGTHFFVGGGYQLDSRLSTSYSDQVHVIDCQGRVVQNLTLSSSRAFMASASFKNQLSFFAAGRGLSLHYNTIDVFNHTDGSQTVWRLKSVENRRSATAAIVGKFLVVAGGVQPCFTNVFFMCTTNSIEIFDLEAPTGSSTSSTTLPTSALGMAATNTATGLLLMAGGENLFGGNTLFPSFFDSVLDTVIAFRADSRGVVLDPAFGTLSVARSRIAAATVGQFAIFVGGITKSGSSGAIDIFDSSAGSWSSLTLAPLIGVSAIAFPGATSAAFIGINNSTLKPEMTTIRCGLPPPPTPATTSSIAPVTTTKPAATTAGLTQSTLVVATEGAVSTTAETTSAALEESSTLPDVTTGAAQATSVAQAPSPSLAPIIYGAAGGGVLLILIILAVVLVCRRRRRRHDDADAHTIALSESTSKDTSTTSYTSMTGASMTPPGVKANPGYTNAHEARPSGSFADAPGDYGELPGSSDTRPYAFISRSSQTDADIQH